MAIVINRGFNQGDFGTDDFLSGDLSDSKESQVEFLIESGEKVVNSQVDWQVAGTGVANNTEVEFQIVTIGDINTQVLRLIENALKEMNSQVDITIENSTDISNGQVYSSNILYAKCWGFLEGDFGEDDFLTDKICAHLRTQVLLGLDKQTILNSQVEFQIDVDGDAYNSQLERVIESEVDIHCQLDAVFVKTFNCQVLFAIYNVNRPRVLMDFPSRGVGGTNWTATSTQPGDFSILNINNDIEEFYWRSATGFTGVTITCDTEIPQGIFMDTFFLGGTNITSSAVVTLEASNDAGFSPVEQTINLESGKDRIYWVSPTLPTSSYRYWRIIVSDPTNPDGYIKVGTIVFGAAEILTTTCNTQDIIVAPKEFKNTIRTEGFTSVGNSRSLKRSIRLNFRKIRYESGDFEKLDDIVNFARTTLKCVWIPDASTQSLIHRFASFGKIKNIPQQTHEVLGKSEAMDHIDMTFEIDEAE